MRYSLQIYDYMYLRGLLLIFDKDCCHIFFVVYRKPERRCFRISYFDILEDSTSYLFIVSCVQSLVDYANGPN